VSLRLWTPDRYLKSVLQIQADWLSSQGLQALLLDIDNTLLPRGSSVVPPAVEAWLARLRNRGFQICLVSNNWHQSVLTLAENWDLPIVRRAMKPLPVALIIARRRLRVSRRQAVMVGDQLLTDVLGARLAGLRSILLVPQSSTDLWYTLILRRLERWLLGERQPEP